MFWVIFLELSRSLLSFLHIQHAHLTETHALRCQNLITQTTTPYSRAKESLKSILSLNLNPYLSTNTQSITQRRNQ
ncbi:hypothetical protein M758_6G190100 [Ceratodon purpureus]|nr:hypothetical protein M758_6G190100 [Ceratodon purpureus]